MNNNQELSAITSLIAQLDQTTNGRRRWTNELKERILKEYDSYTFAEDRGALLRSCGINQVSINKWRKQLTSEEVTTKTTVRSVSEAKEILALKTENERLRRREAELNLALDLTGKAYALLQLIQERTV